MSKKSNDQGLHDEGSIKGYELIERVMALIKQGTVRQLIIRNSKGKTILKIPVTAGVAVGGVLLYLAPVLSAIASLSALLAEFRIEVVRTKSSD